MKLVEPIKNKKDVLRIQEILEKESYRNLLLFCIGVNSGLRISDILKLDVCDVKDKDYISIIEKKTKKYKKIPINNKLKEMFKIYTKDMVLDTPLFTTKFNNRLDRIQAYRILKRVGQKAKIEGNIGTHTLRKTFGYHHYRQFKDIAILQKIFNHSSAEITLRYIGIEQDEIDDAYIKFIL